MSTAIAVALTTGVLGTVITLIIFSFRLKPQWDTLQQMARWLADEYSNELKPMSVNERNHIAKIIILSYQEGGLDGLRIRVVACLKAESTNVRVTGFIRDLLDYEISRNKNQFKTNLSHLTH